MDESGTSDEFLGGLGGAVYHDWVRQAEKRLRRFVEHVAPGANVEILATFDPDSKERRIHDEAEGWGAVCPRNAAKEWRAREQDHQEPWSEIHAAPPRASRRAFQRDVALSLPARRGREDERQCHRHLLRALIEKQ
jgi:hypothetical protein